MPTDDAPKWALFCTYVEHELFFIGETTNEIDAVSLFSNHVKTNGANHIPCMSMHPMTDELASLLAATRTGYTMKPDTHHTTPELKEYLANQVDIYHEPAPERHVGQRIRGEKHVWTQHPAAS